MWSALRNGAALSSSGSSDGYVSKARGWEFAPYSQTDREAARRRSGSPPQPAFLEQPTSDTQLHDLQIQHSRLKRRFEELRRRHGQEKDAWMKEKEMLLREMANLQGGENRRILMELKTVLDEVQSEVKREECRRSELQLQYTKDRCEWELERAELKYRITQLEDQRRGRSCGDTLRMERETERRLLTDPQNEAVDPRCPTLVEHSERDWMRERSELLQRLHSERKEWESQLRDMQLKMEELLNELKNRGHQKATESDTMWNHEEPRNRASSPGSYRSHSDSRNIGFSPGSSRNLSDSRSRAFSPESRNLPDSRSRASSPESGNLSDSRSRASCPRSSRNLSDSRSRAFSPGSSGNLLDSRSRTSSPESRNLSASWSRAFGPESSKNLLEAREHFGSNCGELSAQSESEIMGVAKLEDVLHEALDKELDSGSISEEPEEHCGTTDSMALRAALQEIAMVSEELRSYQDPIPVNPEEKRSSAESGLVSGEDLRIEEMMFYRELQASDMQNLTETTSRTEEEAEQKRDAAPPIPFRSTSWYANTPWSYEIEPRVPGPFVYRRCESPCLHRKCNSPSVVRRFEAMLQENEGKILTDSGIGSAAVSQSSSSRWSCDGGRFGSNKFSTHVPIQKCLSEVNIPTADPPVRELYITDSLETHSPGPLALSVRVSQRNHTLERKTAEFNRALFQAGLGLQNPENMLWTAESAPCLSPAHRIQQPDLDSTSRDLDPPPLTGDTTEMRLPSKSSGYSAGQSENLRTLGPQPKLSSTVMPESLKEHPAEKRFRNLPPTRSSVLDESPWKPWTLAAYPRPAESRSNYGAIEQILKCYESSEPSPPDQQLSPSPGREEGLVELLKSLQVQNQSHSDHGSEQPDLQPSAHKEAHVVLKIKEPSVGAVKTFSRPACPTNRRPPSRWANRSSSTSSTSSPSPPPMSQAALFSFSTFQTETVIM